MSVPDMASSVHMTMGQLENVAQLAAREAVAGATARMPTRDEIDLLARRAAEEASEEAAEKAITRFLERIGVDADDLPNLRKDFASMRSSREIKEAVISNGIKAVVTVLMGGLLTAIWFYIKGGGPK